ncbi:MAG: hypothetical protein C6W57_14175 [Caldibacillus debilis]|nr:MAG: hypothetical protein C6W57_14175 [Caldibacillus debilis]
MIKSLQCACFFVSDGGAALLSRTSRRRIVFEPFCGRRKTGIGMRFSEPGDFPRKGEGESRNRERRSPSPFVWAHARFPLPGFPVPIFREKGRKGRFWRRCPIS